MKHKKPGSLWLEVTISMVLAEGLSVTVWSKELLLPAKDITLTPAEIKKATRYSPEIKQVLIASGMAPWLKEPA